MLFFHLPFWNNVMNYGSIADLHSFFNIICTLLLLPFNRQLVRLVEWTIPDSGAADPVVSVLDPPLSVYSFRGSGTRPHCYYSDG